MRSERGKRKNIREDQKRATEVGKGKEEEVIKEKENGRDPWKR